MTLTKYREKRRFDETPEPRGKRGHERGPLRFVVQKHQASRLHYDFRLELDGTLKSWAVPKGPSLNPKDRRLAIQVEDHPLDYRTFEGIIPKGNYGAGTVMVWDEGTYSPRGTSERGEAEGVLRAGLEKGHLSLVLQGQKLTGEFSLVRLKRGPENAWLLLKKEDAAASSADITLENRSVASGRSLDEITRNLPRYSPPRKTPAPWSEPATAGRLLEQAPKAALPRRVQPMLASLAEEPFDRKGWVFEIKWDGYRAIAGVDSKGVSLYSRNHQSFERRFAPLLKSLRGLRHQAVLDGEIVVVDEHGKSSFQLLQNYQKTGRGRLCYYVFDLLHLDGHDLRNLPLRHRKELLAPILDGLPHVFLSEHVEEQGRAFFQAAAAQGLEGILAKDAKSPYREGQRGTAWLKVKTHLRQEAVIGGFTEPRGSRKDLGALVLGLYEQGKLTYIGHTGGGLNAEELTDLRSKLQPLVRSKCPFRVRPRTNAPVHWVEPRLVCEVSFQEWTQDGIMRQPVFVGLREDKEPESVHREKVRTVHEDSEEARTRVSAERNGAAQAPRRRAEPPISLPEPHFTHLQKVYWPEEGYTKEDLVAYYRTVAPVLLPYLHDRPESLHRHPNGIEGQSFFQKDMSRVRLPDWVETVPIPSDAGAKTVPYLLCQNEATLLYLTNLGCIELNPWNSRIGSLDRPDYLVLDLDPQDVFFAQVIETAVAVRKILDQAEIPSFCKTSGKRGLHVYVPLGARYHGDQARQFAELIAKLTYQQLPGSTSLVRRPALRRGRVYLDFLQNRRGQTLAAPYSARPYPGATVSTPLRWQEVKKGLDPARFTIKTMARRLDRLGDLWQPVLGPGADLAAVLERLRKQSPHTCAE